MDPGIDLGDIDSEEVDKANAQIATVKEDIDGQIPGFFWGYVSAQSPKLYQPLGN
jgi:hypothetical protein